MGHPGGERERSEAAEQHITRRADLLFQVMVVHGDGRPEDSNGGVGGDEESDEECDDNDSDDIEINI